VESSACGSFSWVEVEGGRKEKLLILEKNPVTVEIQTSIQNGGHVRNQNSSAQKYLMQFNPLTSSSYSRYRDTRVVGHEAKYREHHEASKNAGATVHYRHKYGVPEIGKNKSGLASYNCNYWADSIV